MNNTLKTTVLLGGLAGLILAIGSFWGSGGLVVGLVLSLLMVGGSYWFSDRLALASARAVPVSAAQMPEYHATVAELAQRAGLPMPRLYVTPDAQPNAFATGRNPQHAAVAVTEGLLQHLSWDEVRGVLAHELAHVRNRDVLIGSIAAAIATAITFAARMAMFASLFGGGRSDDRDNNPFAALAMIIFAPIAAGLLQMAVSRSREYEADAYGARLLGTGEPLARALEKLHVGSQRIPSHVNPAQASAYIVNPLRGQSFAKLFSTHPAVEERVRRLRAGQYATA
ncbi:MAG: zinc metalloprotease HtpX [Acidimicrobiia bacterium]|nr:zinc metalloprotease HtpX [Acidimicrobiia bacterium]